MKKIILTFFTLNFAFCIASAQIISSSGDYFTSSSGSIAWSIGEPVSDNYSGINFMLTKSFHQPASIALDSIPGNAAPTIFLYPNPTPDDLFLDFTNMETGTYTLEVYDVLGRILKRDWVLITSNFFKTKIKFSQYANGLYLFRVNFPSNEKSKTFKITKQK